MNKFYVCLAMLAISVSTVSAATTTPSSCIESRECLKDLALAYTNIDDLKKVCSAFQETGNCFKALEKNCDMKGVLALSDTMIEKMDAKEMSAGCFGKCAEQAGMCLQEVTATLSANTYYTMGFCKNLTRSFHCLESMNKDKDCKPSTAKVLLYLSQGMKEEDFSDFCDNQGNPSDCFKEFQTCTKDLRFYNQTDVEKQCNQINKYLECSSNIGSCKGHIKAMRDNANKNFETAETKAHCPITGTCDERMTRCTKTIETAYTNHKNNPDKKDKMTLCNDLNLANQCFDTVRLDSICTLKSGAISDIENKGKKLYKDECVTVSTTPRSTAAATSTTITTSATSPTNTHSSTASTTPDPVCPERQACMNDLQVGYTERNSLHKVCSAFNKTGNCFQALEKKCNMSGYIRLSNEAIDKLDALEMSKGCLGKCAMQAGECMQSAIASLTATTRYSMALCKNLTKSVHCLENMNKDKDCSPNTAKLLFFISKDMKEEDFSDICDNKGDPARCFKEFNDCTKDIRKSKQTDVEKQCKQVDDYLECSSNINSCKSRIKALKTIANKRMETAEILGHCPITGTCSERMDRCITITEAAYKNYMANPSNKDKEVLCSDLKQANKCFGTVRKDSTCLLKSGAIQNTETKGKKLYKDECDAASSVLISTALMMLGLAVSLFKNM